MPASCPCNLHNVCRPIAHAPGVFPLLAAAKPPMECGNLFPLSGLQPPANTPVRTSRSPNSDLRSPTPCVLVLEIVVLFPSVPSASSCSFSSSSSRWRQSCRSSADQQETPNDIKQERPRMPVSYSWCVIEPPQSQYPPVFLCVFAPLRLCVKRSGWRDVQVETVSTQSQHLKFVVPPSGGFSSSVAQDRNHERHETHEKRVKIEQEAAEETEGSLPLLPMQEQHAFHFR